MFEKHRGLFILITVVVTWVVNKYVLARWGVLGGALVIAISMGVMVIGSMLTLIRRMRNDG